MMLWLVRTLAITRFVERQINVLAIGPFNAIDGKPESVNGEILIGIVATLTVDTHAPTTNQGPALRSATKPL
jgi:hypothetical protein